MNKTISYLAIGDDVKDYRNYIDSEDVRYEDLQGARILDFMMSDNITAEIPKQLKGFTLGTFIPDFSPKPKYGAFLGKI